MRALNRGDKATFCQLSLNYAGTDAYSANNLGVCYENGWGGLPQSNEEATRWYNFAARHNVPKAKQNLARLGVTVPIPDIAIAEKERSKQALIQALNDASQQLNQMNQLRMLRQQQQLNAYTTPSVPLYQPQPNVNCYSNKIGNQIFTDCY